MKKTVSFLLLVTVLLSFCTGILPVAAKQPIKVMFNGEQMQFDVEPLLLNDRTMVPMRAIFEKLGAEVSWYDETDTAIGIRNGVRVSVSIGSNIATVSGKAVELDQSAVLVQDRTLVPLRFISEAYGANVDWDENTSTVTITAQPQTEGYNIPASAFTEVGTWTYTDNYLQGLQDAEKDDKDAESAQDATVVVNITKTGDYKLWALAKDYATNQPGTRYFHVKVDGIQQDKKLGAHGKEGFAWEEIGTYHLEAGAHTFALVDSSRFFARCQGLFLCADQSYVPPTDTEKLAQAFPEQNPLASIPMANFPNWAKAKMQDENTVVIGNDEVKVTFYEGIGSKGELVQNQIQVRDGNDWVTVKERTEEFGFLMMAAEHSEYVSCSGELTVGGGANIRQTIMLDGKPTTLTINDYFMGGYPVWFIPKSVEKVSDTKAVLRFDTKADTDLTVTFEIDDLTSDPKVTIDAKFGKDGTYSFLLFSGDDFSETEYETVTAPFMFVKKQIPETAEIYPECYLFTPMATFTRTDKIEGKTLTTGVVIDPESVPQAYPYPDTARFGLVLRSPTGRVRGQFCAPEFGSGKCNFTAGETYTVSYRIINHLNDWYDTFKHVAENLYKNKDVRENYYTSINEAIYNASDLMLDDLYGGWDNKDMAWYNMEVQNVTSQSNVMTAVQRYLLSEDEEMLEKRAIPTLAWLMSRGNAHFTRFEDTRTSSYISSAPTALVNEPTMYGSAVYEGLYEMSQGRMPYLLDTAVKKVNNNAGLEGVSSQIAMYNATGNEGYLDKLEELADKIIANTVTDGSDYMENKLLSNGFVFGDYSPTLHALLAAYEVTGKEKFLDGAEKAARLLVTATSNVGYQNDYATTDYHIDPVETMNAHRISCEVNRTAWFWWGNVQWRLGFDFGEWGVVEEMNVAIPEETVPGWLPAQAGFGTEHPKTAVNGNYIYMNSWAALLARLSEYTGDDYFMTQARNAMVGRFGNYAGYYQERYIAHQGKADYPYVGPDYTLIYWHHIPVFVSLLEDYLISSIAARSDYNVTFPSIYQSGYAYFVTNQYGFKPGRLYDQEDMWLWLARGVIEPDSVNVDYLMARKDGVFGAALINEKSEPLTTTVTLCENEKLPGGSTYTGPATLYDRDGNTSQIQVENGKFTVTIPARGIQTVIIQLPGVTKPAYALDKIYFNTNTEQTVSSHTNGKGYALQLNSDAYYAYVYVTDMQDTMKSLTVSYDIGGQKQTKTITEYPFEWITKVDDPNQAFIYTLQAEMTDGSIKDYGGGILKGLANGPTSDSISATPADVQPGGAVIKPSDLKFETFTVNTSALGVGTGFRAVVKIADIPFEISENSLTGIRMGVELTSKTDDSKLVGEMVITGNEMRENETVILADFTSYIPRTDYGPTHKGKLTLVPADAQMPDLGESTQQGGASEPSTPPAGGTVEIGDFEPFEVSISTIGNSSVIRMVVPIKDFPFAIGENALKGLGIEADLTVKATGEVMHLDSVIDGNEMRDTTTVLLIPTTAEVPMMDYQKEVTWTKATIKK